MRRVAIVGGAVISCCLPTHRDFYRPNVRSGAFISVCAVYDLTLSEPHTTSVPLSKRATVIQKKTGRPVQFEISPQTRSALEAFLESNGKSSVSNHRKTNNLVDVQW